MPDLPKKSVPQINQRKAIAQGQTVKGVPNQAKLAGVKKPGKCSAVDMRSVRG